jgi:hypothetical protein
MGPIDPAQCVLDSISHCAASLATGVTDADLLRPSRADHFPANPKLSPEVYSTNSPTVQPVKANYPVMPVVCSVSLP